MSNPLSVNRFTLKIIFLIFLISSAFALHKFYVSLCEIKYAGDEQQVHITLKIFTDDLITALSSYAGKPVTNDDQSGRDEFDAILSSYLNQQLHIRIDSVMKKIYFVGEEPDYDVTWCYLEIDSVPDFHELSIRNNILTEVFEDQVNLVNVTYGDRQKGLLLSKGRSTGAILFTP